MSSIKVSSFGAYLTSWKIEDREVLYQGSELKRGGIPFLFPNFDIGAPLPSHGFGRISEWKNIETTENNCHLQLTENDISPEFRQIYPYKFVVDLKITTIDNQLDYCFEVKNTGDKDLPISPGLHPYWPIKHELKSQIKLMDFPQFNPSTVDWDNNPPNDLYDFKNEFVASFPDYQLKISEVKENNLKQFNHIQVWSQNTSWPDFNFISFEPVTRPKNAINDNPILINSGDTVKFHLRFEVIFQ